MVVLFASIQSSWFGCARMIYWVSTILTCQIWFLCFLLIFFLFLMCFFFFLHFFPLPNPPVFSICIFFLHCYTHSSAGKAVLALNKGLQRSVSISSCKPFQLFVYFFYLIFIIIIIIILFVLLSSFLVQLSLFALSLSECPR